MLPVMIFSERMCLRCHRSQIATSLDWQPPRLFLVHSQCEAGPLLTYNACLLCPCRLVGVARVPKVSEAFLDIFLMLPTDALAVMKAKLVFS